MSSPNKDRDALLAKVAEYLAVKPWCSAEHAVASICDAIRYTWCIPIDVYAEGAAEVIEKTRQQDYPLIRLANFWTRADFKGITAVWYAPQDQLFEQQFHIAESIHARDFTFPMYDRFRDPRTSPEERQEIRALVREVYAAVPVPPGATDVRPGPFYPPGAEDALREATPLTSAVPQVTWYAVTELFGVHPHAVLRRTVAANGERDEAFARDSRTGRMRWQPTTMIYSAERGDLAHWFAAIDEDTATLITGHLDAAYGTGQASGTEQRPPGGAPISRRPAGRRRA